MVKGSFQSLQEDSKLTFKAWLFRDGSSFQSLQEDSKLKTQIHLNNGTRVSNPYRKILSQDNINGRNNENTRFQSLQEDSKREQVRPANALFFVSNPYRKILSQRQSVRPELSGSVSNPYRKILSEVHLREVLGLLLFPILTGRF